MHVGLLIDEERLLHHRPALCRIASTLAEREIPLTWFVPIEANEMFLQELDTAGQPPVPKVAIPMRVLPWMRKSRARQVCDAVEKAAPNLLMAIGGAAWTVGIDLADALECPVVLDLWSATQIKLLPNVRTRGPVAAYVVPTAHLGAMASRLVDAELVSVVRPGVPAPDRPRPILEHREQSISLAIMGSGRDVPAYTAMLTALSRIVHELPQVQAAIELRGRRAHGIWQEAQRLDLLSRVSAVNDAAPLRGLLTQCDVLVMPERYGDVRLLTLEAMAQGMVVAAADDPVLEMLVDGKTAALVGESSAEAWTRSLRQVLEDVEAARGLGAAAHDCVRREHTVEGHMSALVSLFERVLSGGAYSFAEATEEA